ncbi:MAG: porin [Aquabacterium sp.]|nr:porin [Aquabacterium sp.]
MTSSTTRILVAGLVLAACGTAQAQAINVTGLLDLSIGSTKAPGATTATKGVDSGRMTTSWIGLNGSEDLGGGLSALWRMEHFLQADTGSAGRFNGDAFWARNAFVGLSSQALGTVTLGRNTTALFVTTLVNNAFGDSFGFSPSIRHYFTSGTVTGDTGWSDSVAYYSPKFGGLSFGLAAALKETSNGGNWSANVGYAAGPLSAAFVVQQVKKDGAAALADTRTWQLAGSYALGDGLKFFAQYGQVDNLSPGGADFRITGVGVRAVVGLGAVLAQYGHVSADAGGNRNTFSLGYDHFVSKRTDLYAVMMNDQQAGKSGGSAYAVGVRHRF